MPLLPTNLAAGSVGHISHSNQAWGKLNDGEHRPHYGCVGDDSTDSDRISRPPSTRPPTARPIGAGAAPGYPAGDVSHGSVDDEVRRTVARLGLPRRRRCWVRSVPIPACDSQRILFIDGTSEVNRQGFVCENIGLSSNGFTGVTGAGIYGVNRWKFLNCGFSDQRLRRWRRACSARIGTSRTRAIRTVRGGTWTAATSRRATSAQTSRAPAGGSTAATSSRRHERHRHLGEGVTRTSGARASEIAFCMFDTGGTNGTSVLMNGGHCGVWGCSSKRAAATGTAIKVETGSGSSNVAQNNVIAGNHIAGYNGTGALGSRSSRCVGHRHLDELLRE